MNLTTDILWELKRGSIGFAEFDRQCRGDFTALATRVAASWGQLPPAVQLEDLVQVMMLAVATGLDIYDPRRSGFKPFMVYRACTAARQELRLASTSKDRDDLMPPVCDVQPAVQDDDLDETRAVEYALATLPVGDRQVAVINSLARTQSLDATTDELLADPVTRSLFIKSRRPVKVVSESTRKRTRHSVYRSALKMAHRAQAATA